MHRCRGKKTNAGIALRASLTQWTRVWVDSGRWWWTGRPGVLRSVGLQRVGHDWATGLNWALRAGQHDYYDSSSFRRGFRSSHRELLEGESGVYSSPCPQRTSRCLHIVVTWGTPQTGNRSWWTLEATLKSRQNFVKGPITSFCVLDPRIKCW